MTRDEILALEGRDLDAAVAERVMGWLGRPKWFVGTPIMLAPVDEGKFTPTPVPAYSSDIAAAWQVVERMRKRGLRPIIVPDWNERWQCEVYRNAEYVTQSKWYKSAPRAICEAALLAVMGEGEV